MADSHESRCAAADISIGWLHADRTQTLNPLSTTPGPNSGPLLLFVHATAACTISYGAMQLRFRFALTCSASSFLRVADFSGNIFGLQSSSLKPPFCDTTKPDFGSTGCSTPGVFCRQQQGQQQSV